MVRLPPVLTPAATVLHGPDDEAALRRLAMPMPMTSKSAADAKDWHEANLHAEGGFAGSQKVRWTSRRLDRGRTPCGSKEWGRELGNGVTSGYRT